MKEPRRLTLKREALTALATTDLGNVVGARPITDTCTNTLQESCWACSFNCQWTFNTCESCRLC